MISVLLAIAILWQLLLQLQAKTAIKRNKVLDSPVTASNCFNNFHCIADTVECGSSNSSSNLKDAARKYLSERSILARTKDCDRYFRDIWPNGYGTRTNGTSDADFPMAFSISLHHDVGILETFLMLMFRETDSYCFHIDAKAKDVIFEAVHALVKCYSQQFPSTDIFAIKHPIAVYWGTSSVLEADLMCMRHLRQRDKSWKVFLNPAGSELPIQPMATFRRRLKDANASIVDSFPNTNINRFDRPRQLKRVGPSEFDMDLQDMLHKDMARPPFNLTIRKGSRNVALKRSFVEFIMNKKFAWDLYNWMKTAEVPDEHYYATLVTLDMEYLSYYKVKKVEQDLRPNYVEPKDCVRYSEWYERDAHCDGKLIHSICNFGVGDVDRVLSSSCLMANKYSIEADAVAIFCHAKKWLQVDSLNL